MIQNLSDKKFIFKKRSVAPNEIVYPEKIKDLKIKKCRCNQYIPDHNGVCGCGRIRNEHELTYLKKNEETVESSGGSRLKKWDYRTCTADDLDTDAFGEIRFNNQETTSKFIRVDFRTPMDKMLTLMFTCWKLEAPKLLISVTGGAQNFTMKSRLKDVFRKGLVKAALSTSAWISTGGSHAGVMKHVGEAVKASQLNPDQKLVVLGIANWCTVTNHETLVSKRISDENQVFDYVSTPQLHRKKQAPLDPNHSHFILVDNSQLNEYGGEIELRGKLESAISHLGLNDEAYEYLNPDSEGIPIVVLVLEGGPNTVDTVRNSVKNGSPCVFVEASPLLHLKSFTQKALFK